MNPHYTYLLILACALAGPLLLSFDKKVAFYNKWKFVFAAAVLPALFYIIWDIWFTEAGVWSFNPAYTLPARIFNLPAEEILFFFVVPFCCLFIYECIKTYFPRLKSNYMSEGILFFLGPGVSFAAVVFRDHKYSFYTGIFFALFIFVLFLIRRNASFFNSAAFLFSFAIILLPFLAINGALTSLPVVQYNNAENISLRVLNIPVEDVFYGMLLIMMNVFFYEKLLTAKS